MQRCGTNFAYKDTTDYNPGILKDTWENIKSVLGASNEFLDSAEIALNERITSPFYGYFVVAWLLFNWRLLYDAFFVDQEILYKKTGLLRSEYLNSLFPNPLSVEFVAHSLVFPLLLTILFFWIFPYGTRIFYRKSIKNQIELKIIELQETQKEKREEKNLKLNKKK